MKILTGSFAIFVVSLFWVVGAEAQVNSNFDISCTSVTRLKSGQILKSVLAKPKPNTNGRRYVVSYSTQIVDLVRTPDIEPISNVIENLECEFLIASENDASVRKLSDGVCSSNTESATVSVSDGLYKWTFSSEPLPMGEMACELTPSFSN